MKNKQLSLIFFLSIELFIFAMLISFNNIANIKVLSFVSTLLCFIMGLFLFCKTKDYFLMITAIFLTLIADIFFIFFDSLHIVGLVILNIIQILYFLRTYLETDFKKLNYLTRIITIPIFILFGYYLLKERLDTIAIFWIIYTINLFLNIIFTIKDIGINNFFPIGMIFLFVHSSIMMFMALENYITINVLFINFLQELPFDLKSIIYLPAQVILTCSIFTVNRLSFSKIKNEDN